MNYWCLNPGITFGKLQECGPVSILLTSGTLSPMETYEAELKIPFDTKISCGHVIDAEKQVLVRVCKKSLNRVPMVFNYQSRVNTVLIQDLANSIINTATFVPAGLLVFFPSYQMMDGCVRQWQEDAFDDTCSFFQKLESKKVVCIEVRSTHQRKDRREHQKNLLRYSKNFKRGAIFLAVCGGKLAEGIDFADDMARMVIIIGIPYGYLGDCRNKCKMEYLDRLAQANSTEDRFKLTGKKWYEMKAMRAVSQAVGRVIRHKDDFGAVLFLDERMAQKDRICQISSWVRDQTRVEEELKSVFKPLRDFFKDRASQPLPHTPLEDQAIQENLTVLEPLSENKAELNRPPSDAASLPSRGSFFERRRAKTGQQPSLATARFNGALQNLFCASDEEPEETEPGRAQTTMQQEPDKLPLTPRARQARLALPFSPASPRRARSQPRQRPRRPGRLRTRGRRDPGQVRSHRQVPHLHRVQQTAGLLQLPLRPQRLRRLHHQVPRLGKNQVQKIRHQSTRCQVRPRPQEVREAALSHLQRRVQSSRPAEKLP